LLFYTLTCVLLSGMSHAVKAEVRLANGSTVSVESPPDQIIGIDPGEWSIDSVFYSPDHRFIAVIFNFSHYRSNLGSVSIVGPQGNIKRLKNSVVHKIMWSSDSKYLVGLGDNTVRLWNSRGGLRQATYQHIAASRVTGQTLCLNVNWYSPTTGQVSHTAEIHLAIPSLKQISDKDTDGNATCEARS